MEDFERLYREYAIPVKKYVMTLCHNEALADDVTAETFYKALRSIDRICPETRVLTWLCTVAKNTYVDWTRKKEYQNLPLEEETLSFESAKGDPADECDARQKNLELYRRIQELTNPYRDVIWLRIFAGLAFCEIADVMGKSENWARVTFYRGKNRLKERMTENETAL